MTQVFRIGDIRPNPFRNIDRYPINRDKVEKLKESIGRTDFWDNLVARIAPDGKPEIGYGHHRMVALREMFTADHEISLIVRDLDDAAMLHVMADENMQEWAASSEVIVETVRAVRDYLAVSHPSKKLGVLIEDGWVPVKVTVHYVEHYKDQEPHHPETDAEIARCVAGAGTGLPTYALHFCVKQQSDCLLFMEASIHGLKSGEGANGHTVRRMKAVAENDQLSTTGLATIISTAGIGPRKDLGKVFRIAAKAEQQQLPESVR